VNLAERLVQSPAACVLSVIQALILDCATGAAQRRSVTVAYRAYHRTSVSTLNGARFSSRYTAAERISGRS
jgi:hypothetical protein